MSARLGSAKIGANWWDRHSCLPFFNGLLKRKAGKGRSISFAFLNPRLESSVVAESIRFEEAGL